ncbi:heme-binding protein [Methylomonas sp. Kb3]|uniref:SOUL family heme-binding protein n=1 Tax=Methylomonas sp. Kb3 TaxID=1611544 RepID=UPI000C345B56|nr:heme-binding protein [Methylomonas sp. Kb3]PKD37781.1 heme-binding protein [Methylomonas sp. Kb3]
MKNPLALLDSLILTGCTVMGIRSSAEPQYQLLSEQGDVQIRQYPPLLIAETVIDADYAEAGNIGFNRLAGYIFGGNQQKQQMAMTAPVFRENAGEHIAMTAPVLQQAVDNKWTMAFVMPDGYSLETLPTPIDPQVTIKALPTKKVAVLRYSGSLTLEKINEKSRLLMAWIEQQQLTALSAARSAAYDPPWTLPALRRNEIHIDIE